MERNVFSGGDNTSICASGMASSGVRLAFDLQRFADTEVVAVEVGEGKVTLTLPDLSSMAKDDTITLQDRAGNIYGTIKDQYGGTDRITLELTENSGVTHIDATGTNTDCVIHVNFDTLREHIVCTIKNGNDIGSFKLNQLSNFDLGNTVPDIIDRVTLLDGVLHLSSTLQYAVETSKGVTLKGVSADTLTITVK